MRKLTPQKQAELIVAGAFVLGILLMSAVVHFTGILNL